MKTLIVTLGTFLIALIIGCQENILTGPDTSIIKKDNLVDLRIIKIYSKVQDPYSGRCDVIGNVTYTHQIINRAMNPIGLYEVSLHLVMDSELIDKMGMMHLIWRIQGRSDDIVTVSEEGIFLLEKSYPVTNRNDIVLLVRYLVTTNGAGISSMNLIPIERKTL